MPSGAPYSVLWTGDGYDIVILGGTTLHFHAASVAFSIPPGQTADFLVSYLGAAPTRLTGAAMVAPGGATDAATAIALIEALNTGDLVVAGTITGNRVYTLAAEPLLPLELTPKSYVDTLVAEGRVLWKPSVRVVATTNQVLSGEPTVDDVALSAGESILLVGQTAPAENGIYTVAVGAWARRADGDGVPVDELVEGVGTTVQAGTLKQKTMWVLLSFGGTLDVDAQTWGELDLVNAGTGLTRVGNTLSVDTAANLTWSGTTGFGATTASLTRLTRLYNGNAGSTYLRFADASGDRGFLNYEHTAGELFLGSGAPLSFIQLTGTRVSFGFDVYIHTLSNDINTGYAYDLDDLDLGLNAYGYQGGTTRRRTLTVYDGRTNPIAFFSRNTTPLLQLGTTSDATSALELRTTSAGSASLLFRDVEAASGGLTYAHAGDTLSLLAAGAARATVSASGLEPAADSFYTLGATLNRWLHAYADGVTTGTLDTEGATNINVLGTASTSIGNSTGNVQVTGAQVTIEGDTLVNINQVAGDVIMGNAAGTVGVVGGVGLNTSGANATTIGNTGSGGTVTLNSAGNIVASSANWDLSGSAATGMSLYDRHFFSVESGSTSVGINMALLQPSSPASTLWGTWRMGDQVHNAVYIRGNDDNDLMCWFASESGTVPKYLPLAAAANGRVWIGCDGNATAVRIAAGNDRHGGGGADCARPVVIGNAKNTVTFNAATTTVNNDLVYAQPHGEIYMFGNASATSIAGVGALGNIANWVKVNGTTAVNMAVGMSNDGGTANRLKYTGTRTMVFHTACTITINPAGGSDIFAFALVKNATGPPLPNTYVRLQTTGAGAIQSTAIHGMVSMAKDDFVELWCANLTDTDNVTVTEMNMEMLSHLN